MTGFQETISRWSVAGVGVCLLILSLLYSAVDNESLFIDSVEVVLPVLCAVGIVGFGYWVQQRDMTGRQILLIAAGQIAGGVIFAGLIGWILLIQTLDGDVPPEPYYTLLNGVAIGIAGNGLLVAEYLRLQQQRRTVTRQNERLERFASVLSHDLRNPLNVAAGRLELARETGDLSHLDDVETALNRMEALIEDLLTLTRQSETEIQTESVSVAELAEGSWTNVRTTESELVIEASSDVDADPKKLTQIFENLFRNAIQHNETPLTITVGELEDGFYVEDTGEGIDEQHRQAVFESGYTTAEEGTGLGLNIVKQLAENHDWEITVTKGSDGGARFEIRNVTPADRTAR